MPALLVINPTPPACKLAGVVNGIDTAEWSPSADTHLQGDGYRRYDAVSLDSGKAACKAALQRVSRLWNSFEHAAAPLSGDPWE